MVLVVTAVLTANVRSKVVEVGVVVTTVVVGQPGDAGKPKVVVAGCMSVKLLEVDVTVNGVVKVKFEYPLFFMVKVLGMGVPTVVVPKSTIAPLAITLPAASATCSLGKTLGTTVAAIGTINGFTVGVVAGSLL